MPQFVTLPSMVTASWKLKFRLTQYLYTRDIIPLDVDEDVGSSDEDNDHLIFNIEGVDDEDDDEDEYRDTGLAAKSRVMHGLVSHLLRLWTEDSTWRRKEKKMDFGIANINPHGGKTKRPPSNSGMDSWFQDGAEDYSRPAHTRRTISPFATLSLPQRSDVIP
ncbi:hypothetical protein IFM89_023851 [Coptis chinensis]|uniref:Uncharacterized protein n=1 Tax=Coptis chinensis TaxID=261450 RepID=A0A835IF74_9MAGN|nr:hypothetical protein IFM89_023851 [Coptis chinensis]